MQIHLKEPVPVFCVVFEGSQTCEEGHGHLQGIDPPPVIILRAADDKVNIGFDIGNTFRLRVDIIEFNIGLTAALIIGIAIAVTPAQAPIMEFGPRNSIIIIAFLGINTIQRQQALVIGAARPDIAGPGAIGDDLLVGVRILIHEIVIGQPQIGKHARFIGPIRYTRTGRPQTHQNAQ